MKILTVLCVCVLVLPGCTSVEYQKMQTERDQLLKSYESLREEHSELKVKIDIHETGIDILFGRWKFLNLEVTENDAGANVTETEAALHTLDLKDLKNLTLEFFEEKGVHYYRGKTAGGTEVFGKFIVFTVQYGNQGAVFIRFIRHSGPEMSQLLFAISVDEGPTEPAALANPRGLATVREIGILPPKYSNPEIYSMDEFSLTMPGTMQLGPTSYVQSSGLRYYFEKIKK